MATEEHILSRLNIKFGNTDLLAQIRDVTIFLGIIPIIVIMLVTIIEENSNINMPVGDRVAVVAYISTILSLISLWISKKRKEYFALFALIPGVLNSIVINLPVGDSAFILYLATAFILPGSYLIAKHQQLNRYTILSAFLITGFVILGVLYWILFLIQFLIIASLFFLIGYALYRSVEDNRHIFSLLGKAKSYSLFFKTAILWIPMLIVIIPGFYISGWLDSALLKTDEYIFNKVNESLLSADNNIPEYLFNPNDLTCGTFDISCWMNPMRMIKKQMNFQYQQINLKDKTGGTAKTLSSKIMYLSEIFRNILEAFLCVSNILLYFITIRSFMYVFARVSISVKYNLPATLAADENKTMQKGAVRECGNEYIISSTEQQIYYVVRTLEPSGRAPKITLPQWTGSPISRIIGKSYTMNEIEIKKGMLPVHYTSTGGQEFIEYNLKEGEEVIFSYKNFVGITESVKLYTVISFRLTAIIFGKLLHSCARGPGKVIFLTKGKAKCFEDGRMAGSVPINRIITWQRNTTFDVESELNHFDVFLSGIYLKPSSSNMVVVDADEQGSPENGLIKFVKRFLIPI